MKSKVFNESFYHLRMVPLKYVSVIIPVYNDASRLDLCLKALFEQTYPRDLYQVIVVDNGSDDSPRKVVDKYPDAIFEFEENPGSYFARNKGVNISQGEVLAFTDSDCVPDKDWILMGVRSLVSGKNLGLVGGKVNFFFKDNSRPRIPELYDSITYLQQHNAVSKSRFAATANMFTWKKVMDEVGGFNTTFKSGGDREWGERVAAAGYELAYEPEAVIFHPARSSFVEISRRNIRINGGHHQFRENQKSFARILELGAEVARDLCPPVRFAVRITSDPRIRGVKNKLLVTGFHMLAKSNIAWARIAHYMGREPSRS